MAIYLRGMKASVQSGIANTTDLNSVVTEQEYLIEKTQNALENKLTPVATVEGDILCLPRAKVVGATLEV